MQRTGENVTADIKGPMRALVDQHSAVLQREVGGAGGRGVSTNEDNRQFQYV